VSTAPATEKLYDQLPRDGKGCHLYLDWETTRAAVEISEK